MRHTQCESAVIAANIAARIKDQCHDNFRCETCVGPWPAIHILPDGSGKRVCSACLDMWKALDKPYFKHCHSVWAIENVQLVKHKQMLLDGNYGIGR